MKTDNELIAEFMGFKSQKISYGIVYSHPDLMGIYGVISGQKFKYDTSWDWLMPVVEKIKENYDVSIRFFDGECACYINKQSVEGVEICSYGNFEPSITNVYKTVVEFIKWHNQQKQ